MNSTGQTMTEANKIFFSYRSNEREAAQRLVNHLKESRLDVWFDQYEIHLGDNIISKLQDGISRATHMIVLISRSYFGSGYTEAEYHSFFNSLKGKLSGRLFLILKNVSHSFLESKAPFLSNYRYCKWSDGVEKITKDILAGMPTPRSDVYSHRYYQFVNDVKRYGYLFDDGISYSQMVGSLRPKEMLFAVYSMGSYACANHIMDQERFQEVERDIRHTTIQYYCIDLRKLRPDGFA